jgi:predicted RNase H-like HicB family nuclease
MIRYLVVFEKTDTGYSAFVPDLPGCVATGPDKPGTEKSIYEAIQLHIEGLKE